MQTLPIFQTSTTAKFAMNRMALRKAERPADDPLSSPPYEFSQEDGGYNIYFNMFGIPESKIRIALNIETNKFTVFAEREKRNFVDQYLWVFSLPRNVDLEDVQTFYNKGVVQFLFPKRNAA